MPVTNTFSPNTRAKSSEVNQNFTDVWPLDWTDYTPTILGGTVAGVTTYTAQDGEYCKFGNLVFFSFGTVITNATGTGDAQFSLPVTAGTFTGNNKFTLAVRVISLDFGAAAQDLVGNITGEQGYFTLLENRDAAANTVIQIENDTAFSIYGSGFYKVD